MCGILGIISKDAAKQIKINPGILSHRGPDSLGSWSNQEYTVSLGHTRLSVIDLSEDANQPLFSSDGRYVIIYNGEIYNYGQLAEKVTSNTQVPDRAGIFSDKFPDIGPFKSSSDTEVLLQSYIKWGKECLNKLEGMFAFAIYDNVEQKLFIARDAIGIKPIFYYHDTDYFAFASELKALKIVPEINSKLTIDKKSVSQFLHLGYIPSPATIYNEIRKFPQGHFAEIDLHLNIKMCQWWDLEDQIDQNTLSEEGLATSQLIELLEGSVKSRLVADVPVGSFLSGGIDSSLITAIARKYINGPFKTFTIGFEENKFDESEYARKVASAIGTDHNEYILKEKEAMDMLPEIIPTYDEPYADSSAIPTMMVSRLAREQVKVVLTGDGGDELFHGYGSYLWAQRLGSKSRRTASKMISGPLRQFGSSRYMRIGQMMNANIESLRSHIFSQEQYFFSQIEIDKLLLSSGNVTKFYEDPELTRELTAPEYQALFDLNYYLPDDLLVKIDRASMKYGLEARVPLLDKKLVKFALNLDPKLKKREKYLLKQVLSGYLPHSLIDRPKWGFGMPLSSWLAGDMFWLIEKYLNKDLIEESGFVQHAEVRSLISKFMNGEHYLYNRIWVLILLHWWYNLNSS